MLSFTKMNNFGLLKTESFNNPTFLDSYSYMIHNEEKRKDPSATSVTSSKSSFNRVFTL